MIIDNNLRKNLLDLNTYTDFMLENNSLTDLQIENFLKNFEKVRYNILNEIKLYNKTVEFEYEKVVTIDDEYKVELIEDVLKIYIPEPMPSYKNLKTHAHKRILLNVAEATKPFNNLFENQVFIYIKIFDCINNWDIDNRTIKPIADALITSGVIKDDNISKMFYAVKGEYSENPHTEIFVVDGKKIVHFFENYSRWKYGKTTIFSKTQNAIYVKYEFIEISTLLKNLFPILMSGGR